MRRLVLIALTALAACNQQPTENQQAHGEAIYCAIGGDQKFTPICRLEREQMDKAKVFIIRHPSGEFHRLQVSEDGQQVLAADGADGTKSALKGDRYEVILGDNRYVIPVATPANVPAQ